jgi:predicted transposase/invertase (TIGR01784 family)
MLDPKIDVVFKLLLGREDNVSLLSAMIEAVLDLPEPLAEVKVLNPEVPRELADHNAIALDLHVSCADGTHLDIEMETHPRPVLADRATYYLTRLAPRG